MKASEFKDLIVNNKRTTKKVDLCGRIIRGQKPEDFITLTDDPERKIVMLVDPDGLSKLLGKSGYEMLIEVGYEPDYLKYKVDEGNQFKLVVFPMGGEAKLATWDNVFEVVERMYSDIRIPSAIANHFKQSTFADIEDYAGFKFLDVEKKGKSDPRFMTYENFMKSKKGVIEFRAFLYFTVHLRELYSGDGWTCDSDGNKGVREYIIPNLPITDLGENEVIDLEVKIPTTILSGGKTMTTTIATFMDMPFVPDFFKPEKAYLDYVPDITAAYTEGVRLALERNLMPAQKLATQGVKNGIMLTDLQKGFRDADTIWMSDSETEIELPVTGTNDVVLRACARLINGTIADHYTSVIYSVDGHSDQHISFDLYWRGKDGMPLNLKDHNKAARLKLYDEKKCVFMCYGYGADGAPYDIGLFQPRFDPHNAVKYWRHLQDTGQGDIWVFVAHCILNTPGALLHPLLKETIAFFAGARTTQATVIFKGHLAGTDWFGPLEPCYPDTSHAQGGFQKRILDEFKCLKTVDFFGVAEDFCDYFMKKQTVDNLSDTEFLEKLNFVTDGTAPIIPNAPHVIEFNEEAKQQGVKFIKHDQPF